jgi:lipoprotein-anchoring transpeptidase ErfK/SrfK
MIAMGFGVFLFAAWSAVRSPVLARYLNSSENSPQAQATRAPLFAYMPIPKPTYTPAAMQQVAIAPQVAAPMLPTPTPSPQSAQVEIAPPVNTPTSQVVAAAPEVQQPVPVVPAETQIAPPAIVVPPTEETPGVAYAEILADTPTPEYVAPTQYVPPQIASQGNGGEHWIDVDLSQQRVYAYEGDVVVNSFVVSTGTWQTPTVTGKYKVWIKLRSTPMSGPGYYLPDVPYVMYFYKGYGLHGTYWHNNFGTPMSHGCVNLTIPDAEWLYNFSSVGTVVNVHY